MEGSTDAASYTFTPSDLEFDMMDKVRGGANGTAASRPMTTGVTVPAGNAAQLAQQVADIVQGLAERVAQLEARQQDHDRVISAYEQKLAAQEEASRGANTLRQTLRDTVLAVPVSADDLATIQRVMAALAKDPNHIMVLASVAQQAAKLSAVVDAYAKLHQALTQTGVR